jgi:hypothetical protein
MDGWLEKNRMTTGRGLTEHFCQFETGHDNSARLAGISRSCPDGDAKKMSNVEFLPIIAPDMNAGFYGYRSVLAKMAGLLGKSEYEEKWKAKLSQSSRWYSSSMLFFIHSVKRLNLV